MENDQQPSPFNWQQWVEDNRWLILAALLGLILLGLGFRYLQSPKQPDRVEIIPFAENPLNSTNITIDISGSVNRPGIYHLPVGSRVADAIAIAGGLSDTADHQWIQRALNQAEKLRDGQKIYILSVEESQDTSFQLPQGSIAGTITAGTVSINSANQTELEALWGIGPVTAKAIISGRPYASLEELIAKKIIKQNVWDRIVDQLSL